ncbi:hypothetical protein PF007_g31524 [Phytophthora fragariae]|uniref:Uncharacterized protein n=3 Tax=Phytophthora fragariae TaxID=53985 RepID=A0A6A3EFX9_9STRA|nr:hypothetical protein PF009_g17463 [Phytophthora fragariae]KAE9057798.1 hypothetical protein PF007_g31524 [Phytophthora fragariae]KAE9286853.1 hypothetical protein PF001_g21253 [Phytophthora fragariae]
MDGWRSRSFRAADRLPDWYFAVAQVLQQSPIQSDALGLSSSFYAALGAVCETEDKPQPMGEDDLLDEDDLLKARDPPSNAILSCADDEKAATQHQQIRRQELGQSTASSSGGCTDLVSWLCRSLKSE